MVPREEGGRKDFAGDEEKKERSSSSIPWGKNQNLRGCIFTEERSTPPTERRNRGGLKKKHASHKN